MIESNPLREISVRVVFSFVVIFSNSRYTLPSSVLVPIVAHKSRATQYLPLYISFTNHF